MLYSEATGDNFNLEHKLPVCSRKFSSLDSYLQMGKLRCNVNVLSKDNAQDMQYIQY